MAVYNPLHKIVHKVVRKAVSRGVDYTAHASVGTAMSAALYDSLFGDFGESDPDHPNLDKFLKVLAPQ
jgi:hypothetical protein